MKITVILFTSNVKVSEKVANECLNQGRDLIIVDLGLTSPLNYPSGLRVTVLRENSFDTTKVCSLNRAVSLSDSNFLVLNDFKAHVLWYLPQLELVMRNGIRVSSVYCDIGERPETSQVLQCPLWGTLFSRKVYGYVGVFNESFIDFSVVVKDWCDRAYQKGWVTLKTLVKETVVPSFGVLKETKKFPTIESILAEQYYEERDLSLTGPTKDGNSYKAWEGPVKEKPWSNKVTVVIPHVGTNLNMLRVFIAAWRNQTVKPFIQIYDTGSTLTTVKELLLLEDSNTEVHLLRFRGFRYKCAYQSLVYDTALQSCRTPFMLVTHNDLAPLNQTALASVLSQCSLQQPFVGYGTDEGILGDLFTLLHVSTAKSSRLTWCPRWYDENIQNKVNLLDLRSYHVFNECLQQSGLKYKIIGTYKKGQRLLDDTLDHVGSYTYGGIYDKQFINKLDSRAKTVMENVSIRLKCLDTGS